MRIKLWGVRGSIPTPLSTEIIKKKLKKALTLASPGDISSEESIDRFINSLPYSVTGSYGGNTTCFEVRTDSGELFIIDCGTGIKALGMELAKGDFGKGLGNGNVLLTHTHWDHIQGIPFFLPFFIEGNKFNIYSPFNDLKERIEYQQVFTHFPVNLDYMLATKEFITLEKESEFYLNDIKIMNKRMRHPGGAFGYRIEENGKTFIYTSDCEFNVDEMNDIDTYKNFFQDADVVVFDAQYTFNEFIDKIDWGHSPASIAIDIASRFNVKRLILFHHDPDYSDEKLDEVLSNSKTYMSINTRKSGSLQLDIAREGMVIDL
ncbi:MAG: MBL fold metallo-hydrolase [Spirochaetes bacterium]|nr:MBL fold metallo-hydrolase [Spirochaetota bacterium]